MANLSDVLEFRTIVRGANNSNQINVRHYRLNGIGGAGLTDQVIADQFSTAWAANIKPLIPAAASYAGLFYRVVSPTIGVQLTSITGAGAGSRAGTAMPEAVAGIVTLRSATAPPRLRGRMYFPAPVTADTAATGDPTPAYVAAMQSFANTLTLPDYVLTVGANNVTLRPVVFHRKAPAANYQITTATARTYFASQRRRSSVHGNDRALL